MAFLLVVIVAVLRLGEGKHNDGRGGHHHCRKMELKDLCGTSEGQECKQYIPDIERVCKQYRMSSAEKTTTILSSEKVPYWDAAPPVILVLTTNQTAAPGERFEIQCMAEGAPAPSIEISFKEDADLSPVPDTSSNTVDIEKRAVQSVLSQPYAIYDDEGWYRCVAKNGMGVIYEDTYLTVASPQDLCDTIECEAPEVCEADYEAGVAVCVCPYCTWEDYEEDDGLYCGTDCAVYYSRCSIVEEKCKGKDVDIFHNGVCSTFTLPDYSYERLQETEVAYGDEIELTCRGVAAGDNPGPDPLIKWYQDWGADMGGRELIGEGNTLSYTVIYTVDLVCVGVHCPLAPVQKHDTDIKQFRLSVLGGSTSPPTVTPTPTPRMQTPEPLSSEDNGILFSTTGIYIPTTPLPPTSRADGGAVCQIMGDPMISTFDNRWYKQDGVCTYVMAMDCRFAQWFVYGRFTQFGAASSLETVTVYSGGSVLELQRGWIINNNGEKLIITVGKEYQFAEMTYQFDGEILTLHFGQGNQIRWNGFNGAQIVTSPESRTCGLCGNNNGEEGDDFTSRYRQRVDNAYLFASSWGLRQSRTCFKNEMEVEITSEAEEACSALFFHPYILRCHDTVPVTDYELACARSYATNTYEGWRAECNMLQSYVLQCETRGLNLSKWRARTQCTELEEIQKFTIANGCPQENPPV